MKQDKYKIVATFKHGRVWSNGLVAFMLLLAVVITVGLAVLAFVEWNENIRLSIFVALGDLLFIGLFAFEFFKAFRNRSYAKKCATKGIEKTTVAKLADKDKGVLLNYRGIRISVSFHHNGKKIRKHSIYDRVFSPYADKEVIILYSPTYDEVLLCKRSQ